LSASSFTSITLVPRLITGLKHWHLRPDCNFYPKRNFYNILNLDHTKEPLASRLGIPPTSSPHAQNSTSTDYVPNGAVVLFILGEIDCREGILLAVQKYRYNDIQHGIDHTARLFVRAANDLVLHKKFKAAFVHPIPPVLDETRSMVIRYNMTLQKLVQESPHLIWLDFFCGFLTDSLALKSEFKLDGTHLHPNYLNVLLQPCIQPHLSRLFPITTTRSST